MHSNWCELGLDPERFWSLTLTEYRRETKAAVAREKRLHKNTSWHTWHIAALGRAEKMPELTEFMGVSPKPQTADEQDQIMQQFVAAMAGR